MPALPTEHFTFWVALTSKASTQGGDSASPSSASAASPAPELVTLHQFEEVHVHHSPPEAYTAAKCANPRSRSPAVMASRSAALRKSWNQSSPMAVAWLSSPITSWFATGCQLGHCVVNSCNSATPRAAKVSFIVKRHMRPRTYVRTRAIRAGIRALPSEGHGTGGKGRMAAACAVTLSK